MMANLVFGTSLGNVGIQFSNLFVKAFFGLLLKLAKVSFEIGFLPVLFPFGIQCSLGKGDSVAKQSLFQGNKKTIERKRQHE